MTNKQIDYFQFQFTSINNLLHVAWPKIDGISLKLKEIDHMMFTRLKKTRDPVHLTWTKKGCPDFFYQVQ